MLKLKQATLTSLKGVVVVEDFIRHKNILNNPKESEETILNTLDNLRKKKPSKEVISTTGIGNTLQVLENHSNERIVNEVKKLIKLWELNGSSKSQPTFEVRYDNLTRHIRRSAVRLLTETLGGQETDEKFADTLEKEIFYKCNRLTSKSYKRTVRKIVFVLRHQEKRREALKKGQTTHVQFVLECLPTSH
ncbi:transcription elongation factor A N-terminal and central domain-containing protein 2 [Nephila pilipes]|uniref:Transcription elongation factor A N-terminal and central domain-containing protein 2 n=1 Tax=Nephila pilipes TaxID=299642 RepID=A0A8X6TMT6_NEPPI|nr:transcription elongation factor A N-terminal and central domain-containing protein 2 [Nephila pilipes]